MSRRCAVLTCFEIEKIRYRFPNPKTFWVDFVIWVIRSGLKRLAGYETAIKIYNSCRICSAHFEEDCFEQNNRLKRFVLPTLYLPEPLDPDKIPCLYLTIEEQFPPPRESLRVVTMDCLTARTTESVKKPLVVLKIDNRTDADPLKKCLGALGMPAKHHPVTSAQQPAEIPLVVCDIDNRNSAVARTPQPTEVPLIVCDIDNRNYAYSSKKSLGFSGMHSLASAPQPAEVPLVVCDIDNRNYADSSKKSLGFSGMHSLASAPQPAEIPLIVCDIDNRNCADSLKKSLGSSGMLSKHHPVASTPQPAEIPLIVCGIDNTNYADSSKKSLGSSGMHSLASAPQPAEIPLIVCDIDNRNYADSSKKSLGSSLMHPVASAPQPAEIPLMVCNIYNGNNTDSSRKSLEMVKDRLVASTPVCVKNPSLKIYNRNNVNSLNKSLGSRGMLTKDHSSYSIPEPTEIPLIVCDLDNRSGTGSSMKTLECRTCLEIITGYNNISLETEVVAKITISEALEKFAAIQVPETDCLPQQICKKCFSNLQAAIHFRNQVISSYEKLNSRLSSLTDPLLIKPPPCVIKSEELDILENSINDTLEDISTMTFKMEIVEENKEKLPPTETTNNISNGNGIDISINPEKEPVLYNYLKKKYLYENGMSVKPPKEESKKPPPIKIERSEYMSYVSVCRKYEGALNRPSLCSECGKMFKTVGRYRKHIKNVHENTNTSDTACLCPKCGKIFKTKRSCKLHVERARCTIRKSLDNSCLCPVCGNLFKSRRNCTVHIKHVHGTLTTTSDNACLCPKCGKTFKTRYKCYKHIQYVHAGMIAKKCPDCGRSIIGSRKKFQVHKASHSSNETRQNNAADNSCGCPVCGKMFKTKRICAVHLKNVHCKNVVIPKKRDSFCLDCGRCISGSRQKFLAHWVLHHAIKTVKELENAE